MLVAQFFVFDTIGHCEICYFATQIISDAMKKFLSHFLAIGLLILTISCDGDDDNNNVINGPTAIDFLMESAEHTIMVMALERTQLDFTLNQNGNFTVFAPTDNAFSVFLAANDFASVNDVPVDLLRTILLYHVQSEIRTTLQFNSQYFKTQAQVSNSQMDVFVLNNNGLLMINDESNVTDADNRVSNGIVHVVDDVLDLPSIFTLIAANPNFSNLRDGLNQEGLSITLNNITDASAPFTIFAPNNDAFTALIASDPMDDLENIDDVLAQDNFDDQLLYHVLGNQTLRQDGFMDNSTINPLGTGTFTISTLSGINITDGSNRITNLIATNITSFNGVLHTLDFVLRQE